MVIERMPVLAPHLGGVDDEVGPVGVASLSLVDPVQPGDVAPLVLHEGEVDIKDAAIAGVQVGKALVHHHTVLGHRQYPGVEEDSCLDDDDDGGGGGGHDDSDVDLVLLPAVPRLQLWATLFQLQKFTWRDVAKVEGVEEKDEPLVRVVVDADVKELVLHEADGGEPGRLVAGEDRHHVCSLSLTSIN